MGDLHQTLGTIALGLTLVVAVLVMGAAVALGRRIGPWLGVVSEWAVLALWCLVAINLALGALQLPGGDRPADPLHLLYGAVALVILPIAAALGIRAEHGRGPRPARYVWIAGGTLVLSGVLVRLLQTG